jgi:protein SCO1/2
MPVLSIFRGSRALLLGTLALMTACGSHTELPAVATLLPEPRPIAAVTLTARGGEALSTAALSGHPTLLFFGYASCPDLCPTTLVTLAAAVRSLSDLSPAEQPRILFVSVDPARDTPARLADYADHFGPAVQAATGTPEQLQQLAASVGAMFAVPVDADPARGYAVSHSSQVFVLNRAAQLVAVFSPPLEAAAISTDVRRILALTEPRS